MVRQTFGERFLKTLIFERFRVSLDRFSRQFRHTKQSHAMSDVITYPLIQETFAFVESNVECEIDRQNFGVGFRSKQI